MRDKLQVGEYCRTAGGRIFKVSEVETYSGCNYIPKDENKTLVVSAIVKHSPNLIDIIEEGDYVNGYSVRYITDIDTGINILCNFDLNEMRWIPLKEIDVWYEVVTKEQFESASYKVGE